MDFFSWKYDELLIYLVDHFCVNKNEFVNEKIVIARQLLYS